ncbi:hypothetical protein D0T84_19765 [Dysgonomonas sp. 521]|nr:hypothetical protein [Dysgonomonas sp. 521]
MTAYRLIDPADCSNLLEIAVELIFWSIYQTIKKSEFQRGNELVTVLLTGVYFILHLYQITLVQRYIFLINSSDIRIWNSIAQPFPILRIYRLVMCCFVRGSKFIMSSLNFIFFTQKKFMK